MRRFAFQIELQDDCVLSRRSATLGGHESLDFIPGQTLLGACAARLYESPGIDNYAVFHSGRVRFGNALPSTGGGPAWPMPLCWYERKADPARDSRGRLVGGKVFNFQRMDGFEDGAQPRQLREGYVDAAGYVHVPRRDLRMKTAIDPLQGRAARAQLFGYQAIARGNRFGGWVEADDTVPGDQLQRVIEALHGPLLLGRSRSAEYGRAFLTPADFVPPEGRLDGARLTLWLLSDLALADVNGQPALEPDPVCLGLPAGEIDWGRTAIRIRTYTPWNGKRGAPDLERPVIQQGSVIAYRLDREPAPGQGAALLQHLQGGLGLYREAGLGRVWVNPRLLADAEPAFPVATGDRDTAPEGAAPDRPSHPLIAWLESSTGADSRREGVEREARRMASDYRERLDRAYREKPFGPRDAFGPSRAQWGRVLEKARTTGPDKLLDALFPATRGKEELRRSGAVIKPDSEGWKASFWNGKGHTSLGDWLEAELGDYAGRKPKDLARMIQRLAHICREQIAGDGHAD